MKKLVLMVLGVCCLASCKKFLSEYSQSDVTPETTEHFGEIMFMDAYPAVDEPLQDYGVFLDDDVECYYGPTLGTSGIARYAAPIFQWQAEFSEKVLQQDNSFYFNSWFNYYKRILGANVVIQFIDGAVGPQQDKDRIKGEAFALRAFYHFMLVNLYAAPYNDSTTTPDKLVGVPIRLTADLSDKHLERKSVKEVYEQVEKDLDSALMLLEKDKTLRQVTRINYLAAHHLASRVYLYQEKWDEAIAHANVVLQNHARLMDLNTWGGMPMPETKPLAGPNNTESIFCYGSSLDKLPMSYVIAYDISHDLVNSFEPADLRAMVGWYVNPPETRPYYATDFSQMKVQSSNLAGTGGGYVTFNSWRSAEAYLNRAEALIQLYKTKGDAGAAARALQDLNTLRASRLDAAGFVAWTMKPADELLRMCREERRRELYLEEMHRWFDLRRYGMPPIYHYYRPDATTTEVYKLEKRDPQYILPIPRDVLNRNPVLRQNPQIPGNRMPQ